MGEENKYSHEDDVIFERLMEFPDTRYLSSNEEINKVIEIDLSYTDSDSSRFRELELVMGEMNKPSAGDLEVIKPITETNHIKIIDFDKEQSREMNWPQQGENHIKTRYFE